jgi:hypothetical protein
MKAFILILILASGVTAVLSADDETDGAAVSTMTEEEVEAELQRIEEALNDTDELKEFKPSKPLAADLPIALPSDL